MPDASPVAPLSGPSAELRPHPRQRAWVEVSGAAIQANATELCRHLAPGCALMAVVKADGYGHGAVPVARAAGTQNTSAASAKIKARSLFFIFMGGLIV